MAKDNNETKEPKGSEIQPIETRTVPQPVQND